MQIAQRMAPPIGKGQDRQVNRICLRNAMNARTLFACAVYLEANDVAALATVIRSSAEVFSSFETAGDNDNS